jgi:hypothetical protein
MVVGVCMYNQPNVVLLTGTYDSPLTMPIPRQDEEDCKFYWGSHENYHGGSTCDVVPLFGATRLARMPYEGRCGWKGGAWIVFAVHASN